jgi:hypothetical protein
MTEKRNQRELLWFQTGGALNFITAVPHCGKIAGYPHKPHIISVLRTKKDTSFIQEYREIME